jgi:AcrR family transcriptional regulator
MALAAPRPSAREALLDAAETLFAESGVHGVSIADVADAVGTSKANVMHHFTRKERLYGAVLERIATSLDALLGGLPSPAVDTRAWLAELSARYLAWAAARPAWSHLLLRELLDNADRAGRAGRWHLRPFVQHLLADVRAAQSRGRMRACPPALCMEILFGTVSYHLAARPTEARVLGRSAARRFDADFGRALADALARAFLERS